MPLLGQFLLARGLITDEQLEEALAQQAVLGARLGTNLVELGFLSIETLAESLSALHKVPMPDRSWLEKPQRAAVQRVTRPLVERIRFVPMRLEGRVLQAAVLDPTHPGVLDDLRFATGCRIEPYVLPEIWMHDWLTYLFRIPRGIRHIEPRASRPSDPPDRARQLDGYRPDAPPNFETTAMANAEAAEAIAAADALRKQRGRTPKPQQPAKAPPAKAPPAKMQPAKPQSPKPQPVKPQPEKKKVPATRPEQPSSVTARGAGGGASAPPARAPAVQSAPPVPQVAPASTPAQAVARRATLRPLPPLPAASVPPPLPPPASIPAFGLSKPLPSQKAQSIRPPQARLRPSAPPSPIETTAWVMPPPRMIAGTSSESLVASEPPEVPVLPEASVLSTRVAASTSDAPVLPAAPAAGPATRSEPPEALEPMAVARELAHWESELGAAADRERLIQLAFSIASCFASRVALFTVHQGVVQGLRFVHRGQTEPVEGVLLPVEAACMLSEVASSAEPARVDPRARSVDQSVCRVLGDADVSEVVLLPVAIKQRVVNVLYASNGSEPIGPIAYAALLQVAEQMSLGYGRLILARKANAQAQ